MASLCDSFKKLPLLAQVLLLLIPGVNLITEIVVRVSAAMHGGGTNQIIALLLAIITGGLFGWIDLIWVLVYKRLILT